MLSLRAQLKNRLKKAKRIAILGVGSELRGDDAAGILVAKNIQRKLKDKLSQIKIFFGYTAPENLAGEIKKFNPTHLIIIDSAELAKKPGNIALLKASQIAGVSFCTHQLPMKIMADYLLMFLKCDIIIIGIQPKRLEFNKCVSKEVTKSIETISSAIIETLSKNSSNQA